MPIPIAAAGGIALGSAIVGGVASIFGTISELGAAGEQARYQRQMDALRRRASEMGAQALEADAKNILEVGETRAQDLLTQAHERIGDYRRQGAWRSADIMRQTGVGVAGAASAMARSGVQLGAGSAGAQTRQVRQQGGLIAGRERFLTQENIRRTQLWADTSAQRIRQQAAYDAERITNPQYGAAARARLAGQFPDAPGPNYLGIGARGVANLAQHGANILQTGMDWDIF